MNSKLKWHQFLCWLFDHRWFLAYVEGSAWCVCRRCSLARELPSGARLPAHPASRRWLTICAIVFLFIGHWLGSINRSPDLPRVELAQAEIRLDLRKLEKQKNLIEMVEKLLQEYRLIIDWNSEKNED